MDSPRPGLDLEKELTCSICTELLYQPLTLLDCLHTFCGACLKEWFNFQATTAERAPSPPIRATVFTCPACRASVRDTRHNATVVTLLEMLVAAHPDKARSEAEKQEMVAKYSPGDIVMPKLRIRERTAEERRAVDEDHRLMEEVRDLSLREVSTLAAPSRQRRRRHSRSGDEGSGTRSDRSSDGQTRRRGNGSRPPRVDDGAGSSSDQLHPERGERRRRRRRSESQRRQVEHQSSLRSLISSADMTDRDIEKEIEDFARQIQEEGLLDGLDLDNIDLTRDDDLSRKITQAYRRRQRERERERPRPESARRTSGPNGTTRPHDAPSGDQRHLAPGGGTRSSSRPRQSRSTSTPGQEHDRSRPPISMTANPDDPGRRRHRGSSASRSATAPVEASSSEPRPAARSQTDLDIRSTPSELHAGRPSIEDTRSSSTPAMPTAPPPPPPPPATSSDLGGNGGNKASFASRATQALPAPASPSAPQEPAQSNRHSNSHRPADLAIVHSTISSPVGSQLSPGHQRTRSQLFPEPSLSCSRCSKPHIEYDVHWNCPECISGNWNLCVDCYRGAKGCLYWFGFGYVAWTKWERFKQQKGDDSLPPPHMLTASRYVPPPTNYGGATGRKTLTTDDPRKRLETGTFCVRCFAWTNDCYWRCDVCNEGDWGFCNTCVNQGRSCSHMLLPLTHEATQSSDRPLTPTLPGRPPMATILTGPRASNIGPFKPLTFTTRCDVCQDPIPPSQVRYHCFSCTSSLVPDAMAGDYDICSGCYVKLVTQGQISAENGFSGWRRCLRGHRMAIVGFTEGNVGQWRYVERDIVGGRALWSEPCDGAAQRLQKWSWYEGSEEFRRLVTANVAETTSASDVLPDSASHFPPDGGSGMRGKARWSWYPVAGESNELMFPRGAEIREVRDMNGDWFFGTYMDGKAVFPAPYLLIDQGQGQGQGQSEERGTV